jgi:uncharacterized membrane protein
MANQAPKTITCPICNRERSALDAVPGDCVREPIVSEIRADHLDWNSSAVICLACLNRYRVNHVQRLLQQEKGELSALDEQVLVSLREQELISENLNVQFEGQLTLADRLSDRLASFGGSWLFIVLFLAAMLVWIGVNIVLMRQHPFDPYPFILLNLILSCVAALQAPIIMMSQNRQEAKDRLRSEHDYRVNLKAELEIRLLTAKMDQLLTHQWQRLLEIQQLQLDLMEDISERQPGEKSPRIED